eukprot:COSAG02_NODE_47544_length_340_cov_0.863071_1_plen_45_part_01
MWSRDHWISLDRLHDSSERPRASASPAAAAAGGGGGGAAAAAAAG